jgi:thioredoxin reductase (NADPH)
MQPGGQLTTTNEVKLGLVIPEGITGPEMMVGLQRKQSVLVQMSVTDGNKVDFSGEIHKVYG